MRSAVAVLGKEHFTEDEVRKVLAATGIFEDRLIAWNETPLHNIQGIIRF